MMKFKDLNIHINIDIITKYQYDGRLSELHNVQNNPTWSS
jgi:hypothetical protein